jgi:Zn-dependent protease
MSITTDGNEPGSEDEETQRLLQRPALARTLGQPSQPLEPTNIEQTERDNGSSVVIPEKNLASIQPRKKPGILESWRAKGGIPGAIATALIFLLKFAGPAIFLLAKIKIYALLFGSMLLSIWLESKVFGWPLAVGIVVLIFIHECGHALAARLRGIPTGAMVFIPFMGAVVTTKRGGQNLEEDAFIGIMGPIVGSIASAVAASIYFITQNPFWLELGRFGFFINLFNLLPTPPLDGGWIAPLFSPKLLAIGAVIGVIAGFYNWFIWVLLLASLPRILAGWRADPKTQPYYQVSSKSRWIFGSLYLGLAALLALGIVGANYAMIA